ncbi:EAL domain-containing protein [Marinobacterium sp. D7]|uniref:putative bifunctional diguanylate cyclase/phosphodiesterase n=1 Tax=Marinobacterium ramblicola TaxID=2849041 RepID=UPI001C2CCCD5|nr:EAL domain-containing protein [Marinobacterium ramblicola]MBV1787586.1 EAL domain-containing protein [Marinobacterium ramblicola]
MKNKTAEQQLSRPPADSVGWSGAALRISLIYGFFSLLWIFLSDALLEMLVTDVKLLSFLQTIKGFGFVAISTLLIFGLVSYYAKRMLAAQHHLRALIDTLPDLVWLKDERGIYLSCNRKFERLFGARESEIIGKSDYDFVDAELADFFRKHDLIAMHADRSSINEEQLTFADDGHTEILETIKTPMKDEAGKLIGILGVGRDITKRKQRETEIKVLTQAVEQSPVAVILADPSRQVTFVNRAFERICGYGSAEVVGQRFEPVDSELNSGELVAEIWRSISIGEPWQGELRSRRKGGEQYWEYAYLSPVLGNSGEVSHYLALKEDISLRKQHEERLHYQAYYDSLTALPNRVLIMDRLQQLIREARRNDEYVAVMFLDLDDFKKVNDSLGHDVGDQALVQAASRLVGSVREGDSVGRLGGDEFIVLAGHFSRKESVQVVAENILESFWDTFDLGSRQIMLTVSIGIAIYPFDGESLSELLKNADTAMYLSKAQGRNRYSFFTEELNLCISRRLQIEEHLRAAIDNGELSLDYQPQYDVKSRRISGVEALLRWNSTALGQVGPDEFIPIAEQTGLIVPIGRFVLRQALSQAVRWVAQEPLFKLAVNISPAQFRDEGLAEFVRLELDSSGFPASRLELEITEGILMRGGPLVEGTLAKLHEMGVCLSMDDFGTGYSSLSYLRRYPVDELKIDRSFVQEMTVDQADMELVSAAISLARGLGLRVVAEGVETQEQLDALNEMECGVVQGFLLSKPVSADDIDALLMRQESTTA